MNERIFELAEQALEETHRAMGSTCLQEAFDDFYTEKFAEMIVRECVSKIEEAAEYSPELYGVALDLLEHFGVEG